MRHRTRIAACLLTLIVICIAGLAFGCGVTAQAQSSDPTADNAGKLVAEGRGTFRFDTFGDEAFWGDTIKLHQALAGSKLGGVGPGVSPATALAADLKVDVDALPQSILNALQHGTVDLNDPATTLALLKLNAVVGVTGFFDANGKLSSMGVQCAMFHSTVDDSFVPGIGHRRDGWANRDLNVGAIRPGAGSQRPDEPSRRGRRNRAERSEQLGPR